MNLTQKELKRLLHYNPETGIFIWKVRNSRRIGDGQVAGSLTKGHIHIKVNRKLYYAHRLAFLYMEGYMPENCVDHIDRNPANNRWVNLREVSKSCNVRNCGILKNNKSGITGVAWCKKGKKWVAGISLNKKRIHLGFFNTKLDAAKARWEGEVKYGWPNCNTTSSAYLYLKEKGILSEKEE